MNDVSDYDLGNCLDKQFDLIRHAFEAGDEHQFEQAVLRVVNVRRCKSNGTLDWLRPCEDGD
ncbi:hypothetical protein P775_09920 [Puniceibacterium antarcticum]|uniref:Uncharacterized protein n=1 Tax=Puniceibacterium antarcticum TaxID=1206336 RepID=A0A2G8RGP3_9RHOB|nr:hypothetical protein [Puniceibacterium antarcticum]PIL20258.1 hypothetical protein P775_09920 [Puniceibacterium antarcticum]